MRIREAVNLDRHALESGLGAIVSVGKGFIPM
jgi:hypothetical protein